jgi:hypothetical protein
MMIRSLQRHLSVNLLLASWLIGPPRGLVQGRDGNWAAVGAKR